MDSSVNVPSSVKQFIHTNMIIRDVEGVVFEFVEPHPKE
jgi:hypothetical protein